MNRTDGQDVFGGRWTQRIVITLVGFAGYAGSLLALNSLIDWDVLQAGMVGGVVGGLFAPVGEWMRNADFRALPPAQQDDCRTVVRTGVPSHDRAVNLVAYRRLKERQNNSGYVAITIGGVVLTAMVCIVLAAAVVRGPRWAAVLPLLAVTVWAIAGRWESPSGLRERRERVRDALPPLMR